MQIIPTRLFYCKKNRLKYISHLDTMNVFTKALSRSKLPVWYTQGFNPHIYLTILMPLSLGYEGLREPLDFRLIEEVEPNIIVKSLNGLLPDDLQIITAGKPIDDGDDIISADYEIILEVENPQKALEGFVDFYGKKEIIVEKKTKKKAFELDLKQYINNVVSKIDGNYLVVDAQIATGNSLNINPRLFIDRFSESTESGISGVYVTRKNFYTNQNKPFE